MMKSKTPSPASRPYWLSALVVVASLVLVPLAQASGESGSTLHQIACTHVIPAEVTNVDGLGNYAVVKAGDTLCLPEGTRRNIKFSNLHGTADQPITIRNEGGTVTIEGRLFLTGGIGIINSSYLHITGSGISTQCGAEYDTSEQKCGIEISQTHKGIKLDTELGIVQQIEIDHVAIHDIREIDKSLDTRGISVHPRQGQIISGISVHHNYIAGTSAEGIYLGSEPDPKAAFESLGKLENIDVGYNLVENTDYDGINIKIAVQNVKVHHNVVNETGSLRRAPQQGGIKLAMSIADVYNNMVLAVYSGIQSGRPLANAANRYYNNVVIRAQTVGIEVLEENAQVYNNTVVDSVNVGIRALGMSSKVFDNIIAGTSGIPVQAHEENMVNNYTGPTSDVRFASPQDKNFRLRYNSPLIDTGGSTGVFPPDDYLGVSRPQGVAPDPGAFEYMRDGDSP